jgi:hypothetical protein
MGTTMQRRWEDKIVEVAITLGMVDYSAFPYNCSKCSHMHMCKHHELYDKLAEQNELLSEILEKLDTRL